MYHSVDTDEAFFTVSSENFEKQLAFIHDNGFETVKLSSLVSKLKNNECLSNTVCLTFDDGYADNYKKAFPVLKKYNIPATVFVATSFIDTPKYLDINQIKEMKESGLVEFMPHTVNHRKLHTLSLKQAIGEIEESRSFVEKITGDAASIFAYPKGRYTSDIVEYFKTSNWDAAVCTNNGFVTKDDNMFSLNRKSVDSLTTFTQFRAKFCEVGLFFNFQKNRNVSKGKKNNIKYITNVRMPTEKAHGFQMVKMCESFALNGANVELLVPRRKNHIKENPFEYYDVKNVFKLTYIPCIDFTDKMPKFGYLMLLLSFTINAVFYFLFISRKNLTIYSREFIIAGIFNALGFKTVFESHSVSSKKSFFFSFVNFVKIVVTNSKGVAKEFTDRGFKKVLSLPNGVDLSKFQINLSKIDLRKELSLPLDKKIALYCGYLYKWKGVDTVVALAEKFQNYHKDLIFVIVGGSIQDVENYKKVVADKKLLNIIFLGEKNRNDVPKYLKASDVLLLPNSAISEESVKYTSPIKLFEYMASGVPVVASDLPSIREILSEENSVLVDPDNSDSLGMGILKVLNDTKLSEKISRMALEDVKTLTWNNRAKKILEFIS